jgi:hypothetical protein
MLADANQETRQRSVRSESIDSAKILCSKQKFQKATIIRRLPVTSGLQGTCDNRLDPRVASHSKSIQRIRSRLLLLHNTFIARYRGMVSIACYSIRMFRHSYTIPNLGIIITISTSFWIGGTAMANQRRWPELPSSFR